MKIKHFIWGLLIIFSIALVGCDKKVGKVDKSNQRTEEEIKVYVNDIVKQKYSTLNYRIESVDKRKVYDCTGSFDGACYKGEVVTGAYEYIFNCIDSDGNEFYITYTDPHTKNGVYYAEEVTDTYEYVLTNVSANKDIINNLNSILKRYNVNGQITKVNEYFSRHEFVITSDISNVDKINNIVKEFNNYLATVDGPTRIEYYIYLSDTNTINDIRNEVIRSKSSGINTIYNVISIHSNKNIIDINSTKFNTYKKNNSYSKYCIYTYGIIANKKVKEFGYSVMGLEKK